MTASDLWSLATRGKCGGLLLSSGEGQRRKKVSQRKERLEGKNGEDGLEPERIDINKTKYFYERKDESFRGELSQSGSTESKNRKEVSLGGRTSDLESLGLYRDKQGKT